MKILEKGNVTLVTFFEKYKELITISLIAIIVSLFCLPLFKNPLNTSLDSDWNQMYSYFYFSRNAIINIHQFPLQCPYFGGGYPLVANPQDLSLSPLFIIILLAGEVIGSKIICLLAYFFCAFGMYYLCKKILKFSQLGALFSSLSLTLSSWLPNQLNGGNFANIYYYFVPLLIVFIMKSREQKKFIIYSSFLLTVMLLQGSLGFLAICLFLFIYFAFSQFDAEDAIRGSCLKYLLAIVLISLLIGAVKFIPMLELLHQNPRKVEYGLVLENSWNIKYFLESLIQKKYYCRSTIYMGYGTVFLALVAFIFAFRRMKGTLLVFLIIATILFGQNSSINIAKILYRIPLFNSMGKLNEYYSFFIAFISCLAAGASFKLLSKKSRIFTVLLFFLVIFNTFDIFVNNISFHENIFNSKAADSGNGKNDFAQAMITNNNERRYAGAYLQYKLLEKNIGLINWYGDIYLKESAIPKYLMTIDSADKPFLTGVTNNPQYKGELFFLNNEKNLATYEQFTPNVIKIKAIVNTPDKLVINQNFNLAWRINYNQLCSWNGLLAINIDHPGEYSFKLEYRPLSFFIGMFISVVSMLVSIFALKLIQKTK